jgi:hypothetical protein
VQAQPRFVVSKLVLSSAAAVPTENKSSGSDGLRCGVALVLSEPRQTSLSSPNNNTARARSPIAHSRRKVFMKNKLQMTFATLTLTAGLLLSVAAQNRNAAPNTGPILQPVPGPIKVNLACSMTNGDVVADVKAINNTAQTIASGVTIHYSYAGFQGSKALSSPLAPGKQFYLKTSEGQKIPCAAWYMK